MIAVSHVPLLYGGFVWRLCATKMSFFIAVLHGIGRLEPLTCAGLARLARERLARVLRGCLARERLARVLRGVLRDVLRGCLARTLL